MLKTLKFYPSVQGHSPQLEVFIDPESIKKVPQWECRRGCQELRKPRCVSKRALPHLGALGPGYSTLHRTFHHLCVGPLPRPHNKDPRSLPSGPPARSTGLLGQEAPLRTGNRIKVSPAQAATHVSPSSRSACCNPGPHVRTLTQEDGPRTCFSGSAPLRQDHAACAKGRSPASSALPFPEGASTEAVRSIEHLGIHGLFGEEQLVLSAGLTLKH